LSIVIYDSFLDFMQQNMTAMEETEMQRKKKAMFKDLIDEFTADVPHRRQLVRFSSSPPLSHPFSHRPLLSCSLVFLFFFLFLFHPSPLLHPNLFVTSHIQEIEVESFLDEKPDPDRLRLLSANQKRMLMSYIRKVMPKSAETAEDRWRTGVATETLRLLATPYLIPLFMHFLAAVFLPSHIIFLSDLISA